MSTEEPPNVILIPMDDWGFDHRFGVAGIDRPHTPNIDWLTTRSVMFPKFFTMPSCRPTRVSTLTGKLPHETGIGSSNAEGDRFRLAIDTKMLFGLFSDQGYRTSAIGKWHVEPDGSLVVATAFGANQFSGTPGNVDDYYDYEWIDTEGGCLRGGEYITTKLIHEAIKQCDTDEPFFMWLAPHAPHSPFHDPPEGLTTTRDDSTRGKFWRSIEAFDNELGRLLHYLRREDKLDDTYIILFSDNGSPKEVSLAPDKGKGTVYTGGCQTWCQVAGPGVVPGVSGALVSCTDLYATFEQMLGMARDPSATDSFSIFGLILGSNMTHRDYVVTEKRKPNGFSDDVKRTRAVMRHDGWKLVRTKKGEDEFYDLPTSEHGGFEYEGDPVEDVPTEVREDLVSYLEAVTGG